jgi:hypothetical protein
MRVFYFIYMRRVFMFSFLRLGKTDVNELHVISNHESIY